MLLFLVLRQLPLYLPKDHAFHWYPCVIIPFDMLPSALKQGATISAYPDN